MAGNAWTPKTDRPSDAFGQMEATSSVERDRGVARIYLARHGETPLNASGVLRGRLDPELNDVGRRQAEALALALGECDFREIISSPLRRAMETASAVAKLSGLSIKVDERFNDRDYGPWAGRRKSDLIECWGSPEEAPDIEPANDVLQRAMNGLLEVGTRVRGGAALIVSHDAVNRFIIHALSSSFDDVDAIPQETGCFNVVAGHDRMWSVRSINNVPSSEQGEAAIRTFEVGAYFVRPEGRSNG